MFLVPVPDYHVPCNAGDPIDVLPCAAIASCTSGFRVPHETPTLIFTYSVDVDRPSSSTLLFPAMSDHEQEDPTQLAIQYAFATAGVLDGR